MLDNVEPNHWPMRTPAIEDSNPRSGDLRLSNDVDKSGMRDMTEGASRRGGQHNT